MKYLLSLLILSFSIGVYGQKKTEFAGSGCPAIYTWRIDTVGELIVSGVKKYIFYTWDTSPCTILEHGKEILERIDTLKDDPGYVYTGDMIIRDATTPLLTQQDSMTGTRHITDSTGEEFYIEYRYDGTYGCVIEEPEPNGHCHYLALCRIIKFKGNKQQVIASGIKAIYSPTDCSSDNEKLWLKRLYELQNKK